MPNRNVVVFTGKYTSPSIIEHVEAVAQEFPDWRILVLHEVPPRRWWPYLKGKLRRLKRQPVSFCLEILAKCMHLALGLLRRAPRRRSGTAAVRGLPASLGDLALPNIAYRGCPSLRSSDTLRLVREYGPWLGVSIGAPVLRANLFQIPQIGTINLHKSLLPRYRGMPPAFWELYHSEPETGASVHWVEETLDTGRIICQQRLRIPEYATVAGLGAQLDALGTEVLLEALHAIDGGCPAGTPQAKVGDPPNRAPSWLTEEGLRRRLLRNRRPPNSFRSVVRSGVKHLILAGYVFLWAPIRNCLLSLRGKCRAVVLLYHRVDDEYLDSTTVGVEQFQRQLAMLARGYDVLGIEDFLATRGQPRRRPCVVLTFDDGYASKYLAALLLRRHGLPCTFFLSTRMIGTDVPFPHDLSSPGHRVPSLTWDQVKRMAGWGFAFGIHTLNHARLAALPIDQALAEVAGGKADLERHLGPSMATRCLGYPYGRMADMTDDIRHSLKSIGVDWCFSAYGGVNRPEWDPLNVLRCGVDHSMSGLVFRAVVEGWTRSAK